MYSDLTIRLALKNYPKMTLKLPKSIHWFKRYIEIIFYIIWYVQKDQFLCQLMCTVTLIASGEAYSKKTLKFLKSVQWHHSWISLEKLPQNDPWHFEIHPLDQKRSYEDVFFHVSWCVQWPAKICWFKRNIEVNFHVSWCVQWCHHWISLEKLPQMTHKLPKLIHWIRSDGDVFFHIS